MKLDAMKRQGQRTDLTSDPLEPKWRSNEELAKKSGDSVSQIKRYIRLTELIKPILDMVDDKKIALCGIIPVVWFALLTAPYIKSGLIGILQGWNRAFKKPFDITICEDSLQTALIFLLCYFFGIGIYLTTRRNYRKGKEHGSAAWGDAREINKRYSDKNFTANKIMTQHVRISYNSRKHRRNLLTVVIGGSGSGKTRHYGKINLYQARGQFMDSSYTPAEGDLIFFDWGTDGSIDHVGIVVNVEDGFVNTIEGNSSNKVQRGRYATGDSVIYGYGVVLE